MKRTLKTWIASELPFDDSRLLSEKQFRVFMALWSLENLAIFERQSVAAVALKVSASIHAQDISRKRKTTLKQGEKTCIKDTKTGRRGRSACG